MKKESLFARWRRRVGITQAEAADHLGVGLPTIKRWERGDTSQPSKAHRVVMRMQNEGTPIPEPYA